MWQRIWELLEATLYAPGSQGDGLPARTRRSLRYPFAVLRDLAGGQLNLRAMGLVYATLLSVIPAVALSFVVLRAFGLHRGLEPLLLEFFRPVGASAANLTQRVMHFAESVRTGLVGTLGLALLLWTLIGTMRKVEDSLNYVWRVQQPRNFARRMAEYAGLIIIGPVVMVATIGFSKLALDSATTLALTQLPLPERLTHQAVDLAIDLAPYALVTALFTVVYLLLPNTRVRLKPALGGALGAGVLWAATGELFTALVVYTSRLTLVYAGFAIIVAVLLWTYLGWTILLAGAQLSFYLQNPSYLRMGLLPLRLSNLEKERVALNTMVLLAGAPAADSGRWTTDALSDALGLPGTAIAEITECLEQASLLVRGKDEVLGLARGAQDIRLADILDAVRQQRKGHAYLHVRSLAPVHRLQQKLEAAWQAQCGPQTLADLLADTGEVGP